MRLPEISYDIHQIHRDVTQGHDSSSSQNACSNAVTVIALLYLLHLALTHVLHLTISKKMHYKMKDNSNKNLLKSA